MKVDLIDRMGDDLRAANCARVSFDKWKEEFDAKDAKLIEYLANHDHWAPFSHCIVSLRVTVPIFVARQLHKHQVGFAVSESSRRYIDTEPEFYITDKLGKRAENKKQGALENEFIETLGSYETHTGQYKDLTASAFLEECYADALYNYAFLLSKGVSAEDCRMVLPLATYTSFVWTGSLAAWARMYNLRSKVDAQRQTRFVAEMISEIVEPLFPKSWSALTRSK